MSTSYSEEHQKYLKKEKMFSLKVRITQFLIIIAFFFLWEICVNLGYLNSFLYSSPSKIIKTIFSLFKNSFLIKHILITIYEIMISFIISVLTGFLIATILWWNKFLSKVINPYLTVINSLPKVALGPLIIIWVGASINSIITMSLMISCIITIINFYNDFMNTDKKYLSLMKTFNSSQIQNFTKVIIPANKLNIINALKINMSMNFIGVIMGELLVSKEGLGYLIMYGSQVFNINLVITSIFILGILSSIFYYLITYLEKIISKSK